MQGTDFEGERYSNDGSVCVLFNKHSLSNETASVHTYV
jgi:hypothetical protein